MMVNKIIATIGVTAFALCQAAACWATELGVDGTLPPAYLDRLRTNATSLTFKRSLLQVAARADLARQLTTMATLGSGAAADALRERMAVQMNLVDPSGNVVTKVAGARKIPVILLKFPDTATSPYPPGNLQKELFVGPWPTKTLSEFYTDISDGALALSGTVREWAALKKLQTYYAGDDYSDPVTGKIEKCFGFCPNAHLGEFLTEALDANSDINWGEDDNDGPDGKPNSGDDDGYADFVVFVHEGKGGECGNNSNIWSHRGSLSALTTQEYTTKSKRKGGGFIKVDDYVIVPAVACDGTTMIQIGVFAHEFGHAFGLPDLYDTSKEGRSAGVGNWCLMAGGAWGGDGQSPETPSRMSAWALSFLGWINVQEVKADIPALTVGSLQTTHTAWQVPISATQYYLLSSVTQTGFDRNLPTAGLQIWKVNRKVIDATLANNRVNADPNNRGVELEEADGTRGLDKGTFRGGPGDLYPGITSNTRFDVTTNPASIGRISFCGISFTAPFAKLKTSITSDTCAPAPEPSAQEASPPANLSPSTALSVADLAQIPEHSLVKVRGRLENAGKSLFDHTRHIVLIDGAGHTIDARINVPLESVIAPQALPKSGFPTSLSQILGQDVIVTGAVQRPTGANSKLELEISKVEAASP